MENERSESYWEGVNARIEFGFEDPKRACPYRQPHEKSKRADWLLGYYHEDLNAAYQQAGAPGFDPDPKD